MAICLERPCGEIIEDGKRRCRKHAAEYERRRVNFEFRRLYHTSRWERLAEMVKQEEPLCVECEAEGFIVGVEDVHHKEKATEANFFDRSNLQALCHRHHSKRTARGE